MRELERDAPLIVLGRRTGHLPARAVDEARRGAAIGFIDGRMQEPPHQVAAHDIAVDEGGRAARAEEAPIGALERQPRMGRRRLVARHEIDEPVMEEREERRHLRQYGVIVIARVDDQRIRQGGTAGHAAIDAGLILRRGAGDVAEGAGSGSVVRVVAGCGRAWSLVRLRSPSSSSA